MNGRHHAAFGAAAGLAAAAATGTRGPALALSAALGAGAALAPDIDEPGATAAHALGPVGWVGSRVVARISGGHRGATHTLPIVALVAMGATAATRIPIAAGIVAAVLALMAMTASPWRRAAVPIALAVGAAASTIVTPGALWFPAAIAASWLSHMVGDTCTPHGVPWLWPLRPLKATVSLHLFRSGSILEPVVTWGLVGALLAFTGSAVR